MKIIIDVDTGVDDAWGLFVFLSTHRKDLEILGITCCHGNTTVDNVCNNTLYVLDTAQRSEIPVYKGAHGSLLQLPKNLPPDYEHYFGKNGFSDIPLPKRNLPKLQEENAVAFLNRMVQQHKGEITLVCFAPLTNIALAIRSYPDFASNVKDVFIMGGNYTALGNTTMCAEFNFHSDPEATHVVLTSFEKKLTLLPWETCYRLTVSFDWRNSALGGDDSEVLKLLNCIETPLMARSKKLGYNNWISCDQLLAVVVENPDVIEKKFDAHAIIELGGQHTRGQIVIDHLQTKEHNITIIEAVSQDMLKERLLKVKDFFSSKNGI